MNRRPFRESDDEGKRCEVVISVGFRRERLRLTAIRYIHKYFVQHGGLGIWQSAVYAYSENTCFSSALEVLRYLETMRVFRPV